MINHDAKLYKQNKTLNKPEFVSSHVDIISVCFLKTISSKNLEKKSSSEQKYSCHMLMANWILYLFY